MKRILGLDIGTNSIGWALIKHDFDKKEGSIEKLGVRIIPMGQDILGNFDAGQSISQTAKRTEYRGRRRLYHRSNLRRERLHRVLNILGFLPQHYAENIDFENRLGQFKGGKEVKINYRENPVGGKHIFIFQDSFLEMVQDFKIRQPSLFTNNKNGKETKIPYDWTLYYLRKKGLTEPLTKEELAWVILSFNRKRGYYQRGDDADVGNKKYVKLKVSRLIDIDEKKKGKSLFDVVFENGWVYSKPISDIENWKDREKEFIVTETKSKNGDIKRTFKAVDSKNDWATIKAKTEDIIKSSRKTLGEFIYDSLLVNPTQKIRGSLVKTIERRFYKEEFKKILSTQVRLQPNLFSISLYNDCLKELYSKNESHRNSLKNKDFVHLFLNDIIYYHRPLKSKKSTIGGCQLEHRIYYDKCKNEIKKSKIQAISKSHPLFQEFRAWQWIHNLKIKEIDANANDKDVTSQIFQSVNEYCDLFEFLNNKKEINHKDFISHLVRKKLVTIDKKDSYEWNYDKNRKFPFAETRYEFVERLKRVSDIKDVNAFLDEEVTLGGGLSVRRIDHLWHILYSITDQNDLKSALQKFAERYELDVPSFVNNFERFPLFESDYGSYSEKAIKKLLPLMKMGRYWSENDISSKIRERADSIMKRVNSLSENCSDEDIIRLSDDDISKQLIKSFVPLKGGNMVKGLNTYQASYLVYNRHSEVSEIEIWRTPKCIDKYLENFKQHSLRNPIVEQVVTETLRVVRDIWKNSGNSQPNFFQEIHVELAREIKNSTEKRKKISEVNKENQRTNYRIRELLKELMNDESIDGNIRHFSPSHQEILKLYEEGVYENQKPNYRGIGEQEVDNIRKNSSPTTQELQRYRLWLEQGYVSPYTKKTIQLTKLFTPYYQIEHIIPQSRYFDNSLNNKIICESDINEDKGNQTAFEYIKKKGGNLVGNHRLLGLQAYKDHINGYFKKNKVKLNNLLCEDIPEGFINRQMNDTRYISKFIKGLLSNVVRVEGEKEETSKNLILIPGAVTSKLKHDWGLNDKWNELIAHRFKRLNEITNSRDFGFQDDSINAFRIQIPDSISKDFSKKRIDHRHHALDAVIVAFATRNHTNYLSSLNDKKVKFDLRPKLLTKDEKGDFTKTFQMPWKNGFSKEVQSQLEIMIVSFKQNLRIINKRNNKTKKKQLSQNIRDNWAIRKSLHKETIRGFVKAGEGDKIVTSVRTELKKITSEKHIEKIFSKRVQKIISNHANLYIDDKGKLNFKQAFSQEGIEDLNKNIVSLNGGRRHKPVHKVKLIENGNHFPITKDTNSAKIKKFVEADKGTNLFFAIYYDEKNQKRNFETVSLNDVIEHQKKVAHLPKCKRSLINPDLKKGSLLFTLSPNDLVYVPSESENLETIDFNNLSKFQATRIYKMVSCTGKQCFFVLSTVARTIINDNKLKIHEFSSLNKMEKSIDGITIKEVCIKLRIDTLGQIGN